MRHTGNCHACVADHQFNNDPDPQLYDDPDPQFNDDPDPYFNNDPDPYSMSLILMNNNDHFKSKRFFFFTIELFLSYLNIKLKLRKERNKFEIKKAADSDPVNLCRSERIQLPQQSHLYSIP